ncbi:hypothetical protein DL98DRAFT_21547 [Cadophora sp. DSE1049]|nr:hypothetical protein DL98DRAFT_21547 [Cadophora sp. DSE1049]
MPPATSNDDNSVSPELMEKMERLSKLLFPRWLEVKALTWKIGEIQDERLQLLVTEPLSGKTSDAMADAMMRTSDLLDEVNYFRMQVQQRIVSLKSATKDAEETIHDLERAKVAAKVHIVQQGGMVPPDDQFGDWEYDSDDGEGREISQIVNIDAVIKEQHARIVDIHEEINLEACMDNMLRMDMNELATEVKMVNVELQSWGQGDTTRCLYTNTPMPEAWKLRGEYFVKKFWKTVAEEEREAQQVKQAIARVKETESAAIAASKIQEPFVPTCNSCQKKGHVDRDCPMVDIAEESGLNDEGKYAHLAGRGQLVDRSKPKFCTICEKSGHVSECCPETHPEEEQENCCDHCGKDGHRVDGCFALHPEFLREYRRNRKPHVCGNCYKPGHLRKYCPDILPTKYGLRPVRRA